VIYSSLAFAKQGDDHSKAHVMLAHLATESHLREQAKRNPTFTYTVLRQGLYSESFPVYLPGLSIESQPKSGNIVLPHDGSSPGLAWAKRDELGEATAKILYRYSQDPGSFPYIDQLVNLSGPRAYSLAETVEVIGKATKTELRVVKLDMDGYVRAREADKDTELDYGGGDLVRLWATVYAAIEDGEAEVVTPHLREWLGRSPEPFEVTIGSMVKGGQ
jgi:hypothetical protein